MARIDERHFSVLQQGNTMLSLTTGPIVEYLEVSVLCHYVIVILTSLRV